MKLPILPVDDMVTGLNESEERIVRAAFTRAGRLRSNKPFRQVTTFEEGCANYVWRLLCFDLVGHGKHACMPVSADFDLAEAQRIADGGVIRWNEPGYAEFSQRKRTLRERMDALIKQVESVLPITAQKGVLRWGRALGMI